MAIIPLERMETARLLLRRTRGEDAEDIFREYAQDPEVTRYLLWPPHTDIAQTQAFMEHCAMVWEKGEAYPYAIVRREDGVLAGMIEARMDSHRAEIGYVLAGRFWGRGYMSEAVSAVVRWAAAQHGIHRVWAYCDAENRASQRVLEKAGLEREGRVRKWALSPNISGIPRDCIFYSLPSRD
ncbi:MAG: GNAT family N-acetyltransferase [Candidatus Hydrogenedens sp.]|nr:GNAT family N-acetyltransferase [Candidatus Hydrogenedentota bacterium]NLF56694.1 GNAT family N-acetyltransferase [Candidatus Hydrogenedens sp.]